MESPVQNERRASRIPSPVLMLLSFALGCVLTLHADSVLGWNVRSLSVLSLPSAVAPAHHCLSRPSNTFVNTSSGKLVPAEERYLTTSFRIGPGLNNAMYILMWGFFAARLSGRTFVLPALFPSRKAMKRQYWSLGVVRDKESSGWFWMPLSEVIEVESVISCGKGMGLTITETAPLDLISEKRETSSTGQMENTLISSTTPFIDMSWIYNGGDPGAEVWKSYRMQMLELGSCLSWSSDLSPISQVMFKSFESLKGGKSLNQSMAVHARLEDDMMEVFVDTITPDFTARLATKVASCMTIAANAALDGGLNSFVLVLTGDSIKEPRYQPLHDAFPGLCVSKEDIGDPNSIRELLERGGLDGGLAILDQMAAVEAGLFVGYAGSSLSTRVVQERLRRGKVSFLYSEFDKNVDDCSQVLEPWRILWKDGSYTGLPFALPLGLK